MSRIAVSSPLLRLAILVSVGAGFISGPASGAIAAPSPAPPSGAFPALTFPDGRITLMEAIRLTLLHDPNLKVAEQQAVYAKGVAQSASGQFDPLLGATGSYSATKTALTPSQVEQQNAYYGAASKDTLAKNAGLGLSLVLPFRDGVKVGAVADGGWTSSRYTGGAGSIDDVLNTTPDLYDVSVGFTLEAALLRGRGSDATGAAEKAARIDWEASELAYKHAASSSVLATVTAYWNLVGAQEQVEIARKTLELSTKNVEVTRALIAGDELPRAELSRVLASQASDRGTLTAAERAVVDARVALAKAMGVTVVSEANAPLAADRFPTPGARDAVLSLKVGDLLSTAMARRLDRQAAAKTKDSGGVLLVAARTGLRPKLDLQGSLTAGTVAESSLSKSGGNWTFPSYTAGLVFEAPMGNNAARGAVVQQEAILETRSIDAAELDRQIKANVVQLHRALAETADQAARTKEATELYTKTVSDENEKFRGGQSTLIDTITTRQLGTNAFLADSAARQQWALLIAQLRFETGTLVDPAGGKNVVRQESLLGVPAPEPAK